MNEEVAHTGYKTENPSTGEAAGASSHLGDEIVRLDKTIEVLYQRLNHVLVPDNGLVNPMEEQMEKSTLRAQARAIGYASDRLSNLIERIDL